MEERVNWGYGTIYLSFIKAHEYLSLNNPHASTAHCFPIKNNQVLFTVNPRGLDIIGGHVEAGENGEKALMREAMEEGCIVPTHYELIGAIRVDNRDHVQEAQAKGYPVVGYQLMYVVPEYEEKPFIATHECVARQYIAIDDVKALHHKWLGVHQEALMAAREYMENYTHQSTIKAHKPT